jgi:hypothetical protein
MRRNQIAKLPQYAEFGCGWFGVSFFHLCRVAELKSHANHFFFCFSQDSYGMAVERIDFVSVVTPNHLHFPVAKAFLENGFNVVCEKPMTFNLAEALELRSLVRKSGKVFALTYSYAGYPMVKEARDVVRRGELGQILKVITEYPQGWQLNPLEATEKDHAGEMIPVKREPLVAWATSVPTSSTFRAISPDWKSMSCALTSQNLVPDSDWKTMQVFSFITKAARVA